jgi:hypothetical protein
MKYSGHSQSLYVAKDKNADDLPPKMFLNYVCITNDQFYDVFAEFFLLKE